MADGANRQDTTDVGATAFHTRAHTLDGIAAGAREIQGVWLKDVHTGDYVVVRTKNSIYSLSASGDGSFLVAGGWFAAERAEAAPVRVAGCTWGGRAILTGLVAAPGMFIEFDNGVRTTRVREVRLLRGTTGTEIH